MPAPVPLPKDDVSLPKSDPYYTTVEKTSTTAVGEPDASEMVTIVHDGNAAYRYSASQRCSHGSACANCRVTWKDRMQANWEETKAHMQYSHWGYPEEFEERPFGESTCAHLKAQITNGLKAGLALYRYDFSNVPGTDASQLNAHGKRRLFEVAKRFPCDLSPLVIEAAQSDPELDAARRAHVIAALQDRIGEVPEEWVVVGRPKFSTLGDEELVEVYGNMLRNTGTRGSQAKHGQILSIAP